MDSQILEMLKDARDNIVKNKGICKSDVLSLEAIIGAGRFNSTRYPDNFTDRISSVGYEEVVEELNTNIEEIEKKSVVTLSMFLDTINSVKSHIASVKSTLTAIGNIRPLVLDNMNNPEYHSFYIIEDGIERLGNLLDEPLMSVFACQTNFIEHILRNENGELNSELFDQYSALLDKYTNSDGSFINNYHYLPLIELLLKLIDVQEDYSNDAYMLHEILSELGAGALTFRDYIKLISNVSAIKSKLDFISKGIEDTITNVNSFSEPFDRVYDRYKDDYSTYLKMLSILQDSYSLEVLKLLTVISKA